jgi:hypothetical protein
MLSKQKLDEIREGKVGCRCLALLADLGRVTAQRDELLAVAKLVKERLHGFGLDWLGKERDPLDVAIENAEKP